jgi:serine/threonine-protein kinase SRPK3
MSESLEPFKDNGLMIEGNPAALEKIYDYESGGHRPVHLGDLLNQRYKVVHKLGSGGYANVWLCSDVVSDLPRYVAVKIIMADESTNDCPELRVDKLIELGFDRDSFSEYFCLPLDKFEIDGPNGLHYLIVYPVQGPRVSRLLNFTKFEDPGKILRKICLQTTKAMAALYSHGICHGGTYSYLFIVLIISNNFYKDFRPANILAQISGLDGLSEDEVFKVLGRPRTTKVVTTSGGTHHEPTVPQYLVYPINWDDLQSSDIGADLVTEKACVIDFGESFDVLSPTLDLGIPQAYCPPEYTLDKTVGIGNDIWALGCTLFEIRTGRRLFDAFDEQDECLWKLALILGRFPEPWWSTTWEGRREKFEDNADANGRVVEIRRDMGSMNAEDYTAHGIFIRPQARSLKDALASGLCYEGRFSPAGFEQDICPEEIDLFSELLMMLLKYTPEERITAKEASDHAWFKF